MRIGLFTEAYYPIISGVSLSVHTLANELMKLGHEVFIITNYHEHAEEEDQVLRLGGYRLPMKGLKEYRIGKVTRKKMREIEALQLDIVHCHTEFTMGRLGRKAGRKLNIPIVHTYHTMYEDYVHFISKTLVIPLRIVSKFYSRSFANRSDAVIFPTIKVQRTFERYGYKKDGYVIPTGIYLEQFRKINYSNDALIAKKEELGLRPDDFICLFLGRLSREKSISDLICEFQKITDENVKLLLVGGGPDMELFQKTAEKCNISDRIVFTGMVQPDEVGLYYHLADLFVNFSVTETQGLTYIEALGSGLPLLVKYDDNLEGVVQEGQNGYTFTNNEEFVSLFYKIYKDPILYNRLKHNASKEITRFSAKQYAKSVEAVYQSLLKG